LTLGAENDRIRIGEGRILGGLLKRVRDVFSDSGCKNLRIISKKLAMIQDSRVHWGKNRI
jgi:hypothetical protein